jgi:hypothetical protein
LRAVVDHYVDRPGVEEPRGLKLTGTNSSIGLNGHCSCTATTASPNATQISNATDDVFRQSPVGSRQSDSIPTAYCRLPIAGLVARFADLAAMPGGPHPIPSRTRSLSPPGPMVLCLKAWESRSLPGLPSARNKVPGTLVHNVSGFGRFAAAATSGRLC